MTVTTDFVKITPKASQEVIKLVKAENNPEIGLKYNGKDVKLLFSSITEM